MLTRTTELKKRVRGVSIIICFSNVPVSRLEASLRLTRGRISLSEVRNMEIYVTITAAT
jgi:hypothetical protein